MHNHSYITVHVYFHHTCNCQIYVPLWKTNLVGSNLFVGKSNSMSISLHSEKRSSKVTRKYISMLLFFLFIYLFIFCRIVRIWLYVGDWQKIEHANALSTKAQLA